jgi:isopropylmalate/homocitrate/citramalate synthase
MITLTFDTLQFVQRLKKAGVKEMEAEAIAEAVRDVQTAAEVATKQDLSITETMLRRELSVTEAKLEAKIAETKADLIRWVVSVGVLQTAIIGALLMKLIPG